MFESFYLQFINAIINGIIANLDAMLPTTLLEQYNVRHIVLCGRATTRRYRRAIERCYGSRFSIVTNAAADNDEKKNWSMPTTAAFGAALIAKEHYADCIE